MTTEGRTRARLALLAGLLSAAVLHCETAPPEPPLSSPESRSPEVRSALEGAGAAYQRGDLQRTVEMLRRAAANAPDDLDIALDLGDTLNRLGHNEAAREHYLEFVARHPAVSQVRQALGLTLITLGRWEEARDQFQTLVRQHPGDPAALLNTGLSLNRLGRYKEARDRLAEAASLSPNDAEIQTELGIACLRLDRLPEAAAALKRAVDIEPFRVAALHNLGNCYARMGREQEAKAVLDQFLKASNRQERFFDEKRLFRAAQGRAEELSLAGNQDKALEALLAYRKDLEEFPPFHQELGVAYLRLGKTREATEAFQRALDMNPELVESRAHLIALYQQAGNRERAMKLREAAARQAADARTSGSP
jgi:protein O-GlcNAc transferase